MRALVAASWVLLLARPAFSCPTCGAGDEELAIASVPGVSGRASADLGIASDARGSGPAALERTDVRADLALSVFSARSFSLAAQLPWLWRTASFSDGSTLHLSGPGDGELRARWTLRRELNAYTIGAGTQLPTAPLLRDAFGAPLDWRVQLGSGAFEPLASASYERVAERWSGSATLTLLWPTPGWLGVTPGRSVRGSLAAEESLGTRVRVRLALDLRWDEAWRVDSGVDPDSGGFVAYAAPELRVALARGLALGFTARFPFLEAMRGTQLHGALYRLAISFEP